MSSPFSSQNSLSTKSDKQKFKGIDINTIFKGSSASPPKTNNLNRHHGLQILGKVQNTRRVVPASLNSLNTGGAKWKEDKNEVSSSGAVKNVPPLQVDGGSSIRQEQMNPPLWSDVTSTRSRNTDCYSLQEDFPELGSAAYTSTTTTQNPPTEVVSSAAPSLRPQNLAKWKDGGGVSNRSRDDEEEDEAPMYHHPPDGPPHMPPYPPHYGHQGFRMRFQPPPPPPPFQMFKHPPEMHRVPMMLERRWDEMAGQYDKMRLSDGDMRCKEAYEPEDDRRLARQSSEDNRQSSWADEDMLRPNSLGSVSDTSFRPPYRPPHYRHPFPPRPPFHEIRAPPYDFRGHRFYRPPQRHHTPQHHDMEEADKWSMLKKKRNDAMWSVAERGRIKRQEEEKKMAELNEVKEEAPVNHAFNRFDDGGNRGGAEKGFNRPDRSEDDRGMYVEERMKNENAYKADMNGENESWKAPHKSNSVQERSPQANVSSLSLPHNMPNKLYEPFAQPHFKPPQFNQPFNQHFNQPFNQQPIQHNFNPTPPHQAPILLKRPPLLPSPPSPTHQYYQPRPDMSYNRHVTPHKQEDNFPEHPKRLPDPDLKPFHQHEPRQNFQPGQARPPFKPNQHPYHKRYYPNEKNNNEVKSKKDEEEKKIEDKNDEVIKDVVKQADLDTTRDADIKKNEEVITKSTSKESLKKPERRRENNYYYHRNDKYYKKVDTKIQKDEQVDKKADETTEKKTEDHTIRQMEDKTVKKAQTDDKADTHVDKMAESVNMDDVRPPKKEHRYISREFVRGGGRMRGRGRGGARGGRNEHQENQGRRYDWRAEERGGDGGKQEDNKQQTKKNKISLPTKKSLITIQEKPQRDSTLCAGDNPDTSKQLHTEEKKEEVKNNTRVRTNRNHHYHPVSNYDRRVRVNSRPNNNNKNTLNTQKNVPNNNNNNSNDFKNVEQPQSNRNNNKPTTKSVNSHKPFNHTSRGNDNEEWETASEGSADNDTNKPRNHSFRHHNRGNNVDNRSRRECKLQQ